MAVSFAKAALTLPSLSYITSCVAPCHRQGKASTTQPWPLLSPQPHRPFRKPQRLTLLSLQRTLQCSASAAFTQRMHASHGHRSARLMHTPLGIQLQGHLAGHLGLCRFPSLELPKDPVQAFIVTSHKILPLFSMLNLKAGIILFINEQSRLVELNFSFSRMS